MQIHIQSYDVGRHINRNVRTKSLTCSNNNNAFHLSGTFSVKILSQTWSHWTLPQPFEEGNLNLEEKGRLWNGIDWGPNPGSFTTMLSSANLLTSLELNSLSMKIEK